MPLSFFWGDAVAGLNEKYKWAGRFDEIRVTLALPALLARHVPGYGPEAPGDALRLIRMLAQDPRITDLRYMAYMLATAATESKKIKQYALPRLDKKGVPLVNAKTGLPVMRLTKLWTVFQPIEETGLGGTRDYRDPVKVAQTATGALVTERDGDQFEVATDGCFGPAAGTARTAQRGATHGIKAHTKYVSAQGAEHAYYGRGLVQLTWWNSYASAGILLGLGLDLLFDPEKLLDFDVSYRVMAIGMIEGKSFANGRKCSDYFNDSKTDYAGARAMVNAKDPVPAIVSAALAFEEMLLDARQQSPK
jgi:hypothetical protein